MNDRQTIIELLAQVDDGTLTITRADGQPIEVVARDDENTHAIAVVEYGSTGDAVKACQALLNMHGCKLDVDGIFGALTQQALMTITGNSVCGLPEWNILTRGTDTDDD